MALVLVCLIGVPSSAKAAEQGHVGQHLAPWALLLVLGRGAVMVTETYAGWNAPVYLTEENRRPERGVPRALFGGIAIVATIYVLMNVALLSVLPLDKIAQSKLPLAEATALDSG